MWNAPQRIDEHEVRACRCALEFQEGLLAFNERQRSQGRPSLETRVGIHTGVAIVGNVGTADRLEYTALGDIVNIAARLEQTNKNYGTRISELRRCGGTYRNLQLTAHGESVAQGPQAANRDLRTLPAAVDQSPLP
jgi:class 3 adenylate cyclase